MSSIEIFEANQGTRNENEAAALVLEAAKAHLFDNPDQPLESACADLTAGILLGNLSLVVYPEQELKVRRGGL
jgi:hypothetical protein